jgi:hypothetical protein
MTVDEGNATVVGKKEIVVQVALATEPEMFDLNLGPNSTSGADDSATTQVM